jgi:hypothetical protein
LRGMITPLPIADAWQVLSLSLSLPLPMPMPLSSLARVDRLIPPHTMSMRHSRSEGMSVRARRRTSLSLPIPLSERDHLRRDPSDGHVVQVELRRGVSPERGRRARGEVRVDAEIVR